MLINCRIKIDLDCQSKNTLSCLYYNWLKYTFISIVYLKNVLNTFKSHLINIKYNDVN